MTLKTAFNFNYSKKKNSLKGACYDISCSCHVSHGCPFVLFHVSMFPCFHVLFVHVRNPLIYYCFVVIFNETLAIK